MAAVSSREQGSDCGGTGPVVVSVASGKGGTGKTTVALSLARAASDTLRVQILDCDVEEPNCHIFARPVVETEEAVCVPTPSVDMETCSHCGLCAQVCAFHAILASSHGVVVLPELCHGCGACAVMCPTRSIREDLRPIGSVMSGQSEAYPGIALCYGSLRPGEALATPIISAVRQRASRQVDLVIIDAPPGTSCGMVHSVKGSDFCVLVTEPTPLGVHDLELAWETTNKLGVTSGVVINRSGLAETDVREFCRGRGLRVLADIPVDRRIATAYARGLIVIDAVPDYRERFNDLLQELMNVGATRR